MDLCETVFDFNLAVNLQQSRIVLTMLISHSCEVTRVNFPLPPHSYLATWIGTWTKTLGFFSSYLIPQSIASPNLNGARYIYNIISTTFTLI